MNDRAIIPWIKVVIISGILSAAGGTWFVLSDDEKFKVDVKIENVQQFGNNIHFTLYMRLTNKMDKDVVIESASATAWTADKTTVLFNNTDDPIQWVSVPAGQTVTNAYPIIVTNAHEVGTEVYVEAHVEWQEGGVRHEKDIAKTYNLLDLR